MDGDNVILRKLKDQPRQDNKIGVQSHLTKIFSVRIIAIFNLKLYFNVLFLLVSLD